MEISQVITGMILFAMVMFIADLYIEVKELKNKIWCDKVNERHGHKVAPPLPKYDNPPAPPRRLFTEEFVKAQEGKIKSLKAELNKVKFDYACEVAGEKEKNTEELEELEEIRALISARVIKHRLDMKAKLKEFGAIRISKLKPKHYKRFKEYLLTLESDHV